MSVLVAFDLKVSFFFICLSPFLPRPLPFSLLSFSYSVTSKPSFFKPLPSSCVYFPYFGWKVYGSKLSLWLLLLQLFLLLGHICFGRCVYGHDTNWLFHVPLTKLLYHAIWWTRCPRGSMQLPFCNLYCLVPSQFSSELDSSSEWSYQSWTCCAFIFYFYFLPYVFSGSLSGKEQNPSHCSSSTMQYRLLPPRIQNIKAHCFFYSWWGDRGDAYHKSAT